jgi:hypothetical protein
MRHTQPTVALLLFHVFATTLKPSVNPFGAYSEYSTAGRSSGSQMSRLNLREMVERPHCARFAASLTRNHGDCSVLSGGADGAGGAGVARCSRRLHRSR